MDTGLYRVVCTEFFVSQMIFLSAFPDAGMEDDQKWEYGPFYCRACQVVTMECWPEGTDSRRCPCTTCMNKALRPLEEPEWNERYRKEIE